MTQYGETRAQRQAPAQEAAPPATEQDVPAPTGAVVINKIELARPADPLGQYYTEAQMRGGSGLFVTPARSPSPDPLMPNIPDDSRFFIVKCKYPFIRQAQQAGAVTMRYDVSHRLRDVLVAYTTGYLIFVASQGLQIHGYARLGSERTGGRFCEFEAEWVREATVPFNRYRAHGAGGSTSVQKCRSGQEVPFEVGSALLRIIHAVSDEVEVPESVAAATRTIKAER